MGASLPATPADLDSTKDVDRAARNSRAAKQNETVRWHSNEEAERGLLSTDYFVVAWDWRHYVWAILLAMISVFIASYVAARRAGLLSPVVTLRGSSG
jgi:ABC-type lipoprotein release transport system permease subunit